MTLNTFNNVMMPPINLWGGYESLKLMGSFMTPTLTWSGFWVSWQTLFDPFSYYNKLCYCDTPSPFVCFWFEKNLKCTDVLKHPRKTLQNYSTPQTTWTKEKGGGNVLKEWEPYACKMPWLKLPYGCLYVYDLSNMKQFVCLFVCFFFFFSFLFLYASISYILFQE